MRLHYYRFPDNTNEEVLKKHGCEDGEDYIGGISITTAKQLLKQYGGCGWTEHIDRDGGLFETSSIEIKGNNSKFKYNEHL